MAGSRKAQYDRISSTSWLKQLREVCTEKGIALIFDEVFLGFRLAPGGAQEELQDKSFRSASQASLALGVRARALQPCVLAQGLAAPNLSSQATQPSGLHGPAAAESGLSAKASPALGVGAQASQTVSRGHALPASGRCGRTKLVPDR